MISDCPVLGPSFEAPLPLPQVVARIRDWDDNVLHMRAADFYLVRRGREHDSELLERVREWVASGERAALDPLLARGVLKGPITTREFPAVRRALRQDSNRGPWAGYVAHPNVASPPLLAEEFCDRNFFREHLSEALADPTSRGPQWESYLRDLNDPATAQWTGIITSRTMAAKTIYEGHDSLVHRGYVRYRPNRRLIIPVNSRGFQAMLEASLDRPEGAKTLAAMAILDHLQSVPLSARALRVGETSSGTTRLRAMHLFEFSDDDADTIQFFIRDLWRIMEAEPRRWSKVKILARCTGGRDADGAAGAPMVVEPDVLRSVTQAEREWLAAVLEANQRHVVPPILRRVAKALSRRNRRFAGDPGKRLDLELLRGDLSWLRARLGHGTVANFSAGLDRDRPPVGDSHCS